MLSWPFFWRKSSARVPRVVKRAEQQAPKSRLAQVPVRQIVSEKDITGKKWKVIGADKGLMLNATARRDIAVLELAVEPGEPKSCIIICQRDRFGDTVFLDIQNQVTKLGYTIKEFGRADSGFLAKLNEGIVEINDDSLDYASKELANIIDHELIERALDRGASDIHVEVRERDAKILMRIHGELTQVGSWGKDKTERILRVLFMLADEKTKAITMSDDHGQSMSIKRMVSGTTVKLRVQSESAYPTGKDIVIRVLPEGVEAKVKSLEELGYAPGHLEMLNTMISSPSGAIVIAGTTGSGKSTSIQTMMHDIRIANPGIKLYSIEDPPEYILHGVTQIPVRSESKDAFADVMRNVMRMDPDVIMVGELRDSKAAELLTSMVQSGHKVLTTVHAASAFGITERLGRMELDSRTLTGRTFISGLIYQTLVPVLCPRCKRDYVPEEWADYDGGSSDAGVVISENVVNLRSQTAQAKPVKQSLGLPGLHDRLRLIRRPGDRIFVRGNDPDCPHCTRGIAGRTVCAELVLPNENIRMLIREGRLTEAEKLWRSARKPGREDERSVEAMSGMSALDHAILKMRAGIVSPVDVEAQLGFLTGYETNDLLDEVSAGSNTDGLFGFKE